MRERLQRRKKKPTAEGTETTPPPLQPAYFDEQAPASPVKETRPKVAKREAPSENETDLPAVADTQPAAEQHTPPPAWEGSPSRGGSTDRGRGRRRRGGRGRSGGSDRQRSVAQTVAPAATKGLIEGGSEEVSPTTRADVVAASAAQATGHVAVPVVSTPRTPKGVVVLAIGLPGSGKSSWFKRNSVVPLSSDMVRSLLFDDPAEQRFQDLVFSNLRSMLKARLIARRPMNYVDATNLTPHERHNWIKLAKDYGYEVQAVFFDVPLELCIERHQRRDRVVPEDVMRRMATKLKAPTFDEGFSKITVVRVKKKD